MNRIETLDYITELLLSIIDLNEIILNSIEYADSLVQRDVLMNIWNSLNDDEFPEINDREAETLELLIVYMSELNYSVDELVKKRNYIQNIKK